MSYRYATPRTLMMRYLDDNSHPHLIRWMDKENEIVTCDAAELHYEWLKIARPGKYSDVLRRQGLILEENMHEFGCGALASTSWTEECTRDSQKIVMKLVTKSTEPRYIANHFIGNKLIEWIIQLLFERTHVDLIQFTTSGSYRFQLLNISGLGELYTKVQKVTTKCPLYYTKQLIAGYCLNGILIQIDAKKHIYDFDEEWIANELNRTADVIPIISKFELHSKSLAEYPELTTPE